MNGALLCLSTPGGGGWWRHVAAKFFKISLKFNYLSNKLISRLITLILSLPGVPEGDRGSVLSYSVAATLKGPQGVNGITRA